MPIEKELLSTFKSVKKMEYGAKFFKTDLHFHTPASEDARGKNKYGFNPYRKKIYPENDQSPHYNYKVEAIRDNIITEARELARKIVDQFLEANLSLVAVTDHNSIGTIWLDKESKKSNMDLAAPTWYELIDDEARKINREDQKRRLTILPGTELSTTGMHILAVFPPQNPRRKIHFMICDLLNEMGFSIDDWGKNPKVGTKSVFDAINLIIKKGGIPIPAHIDGSDQAMLKLHKINSGAMKNILINRHLSALEIVKPEKFSKKDTKLKKTLKHWIAEFRNKNNLSSFAFFQGSDAHELNAIAKRCTYVKMTSPTFEGLETAIKMPSSRVRISDLFINKHPEGVFVHSISFKNSFLGNRVIRLNRHLNCVTGKKESGKSLIFSLMQNAIKPGLHKIKGQVTLYIEKIINAKSSFYAFHSDGENFCGLYEINPDNSSVKPLRISQAENLGIIPGFYNSDKIEQLISSKNNLDMFLSTHFGKPTKPNTQHINKSFSIPDFLDKEEQLLTLEVKNDKLSLAMNVNWRKAKEKMTDFFKLSMSIRRTALMCMFIIMKRFGPAIIDAPETHFDNEDIMNFLVPVIKKYKDTRQVILFTNNPVMAVNTDPDNYILLTLKGTKIKNILSGFAIDDQTQKHRLINIMEGNLKSFQKRGVRYGSK